MGRADNSNYMKHIFAGIAIMLIVTGCTKKIVEYTVTVQNSEIVDIEIRSEELTGGIVKAGAEKTFSGYKMKRESDDVTIGYYFDKDSSGNMVKYSPGIVFGIEEGGSFYHVIGSGTVTKL